MSMDDVMFMGLDEMQCYLFADEQRKQSPTSIMPWEWGPYIESVDDQFLLNRHMAYQFALKGIDFYRRAHPFGSHWSIPIWEPSPNDFQGV